RAERENGWFTAEFIKKSTDAIANQFLQPALLEDWTKRHQVAEGNTHPKKVGIVMAGNIPLVGFHDWLCCFITGNKAIIKLSSKDNVLLKHLLSKLTEWEPAVAATYELTDFLKGCDAYIATGSNNSAGYFDYYFSKFPNIIRRNRTSVAILTGTETSEAL